jgi:hypothetical protein
MNMTYKEFKDKYNGKYVDYDGYYGYQCWDLAQAYNTQVLNVPSWVLSGCGGVKNMLYPPKRADLDKYFDEVDTHAMQQGDICIWDCNEDGHIAIYDHYENGQCYYFSQNPNPCQVMIINLPNHHAFRLKKEEITPTVPRDEFKNQIEVLVDDLRVRACGSENGDILGKASIGFYNYYEVVDNGYKWYRITNDNRSQWIASKEGEWTKVYPAKEKPKVGDIIEIPGEYKIVDTKNDMACVFMDSKEVWIPFNSLKIKKK